MNFLFFYIPFYYSFITRLNSNKKRLAWLFSYLTPVLLCFVFFMGKYSFLLSICVFFTSLLTIYTIYEAGYIYNDAEVIKKEHNPTLRLTDAQLIHYDENKNNIYLFRFFVLLLLIFFSLSLDNHLSIALSISSLAIFLLYFLYNSIRSRWNIPLYSLLVFIRYFGVFLFFLPMTKWSLFWVIYPLCATIEFMSKPRFNYSLGLIWDNIDLFRVWYYSFILLVFFLLHCFFAIDYSFVILVCYFLVFRFFSYVFFAKKYRVN